MKVSSPSQRAFCTSLRSLVSFFLSSVYFCVPYNNSISTSLAYSSADSSLFFLCSCSFAFEAFQLFQQRALHTLSLYRPPTISEGTALCRRPRRLRIELRAAGDVAYGRIPARNGRHDGEDDKQHDWFHWHDACHDERCTDIYRAFKKRNKNNDGKKK